MGKKISHFSLAFPFRGTSQLYSTYSLQASSSSRALDPPTPTPPITYADDADTKGNPTRRTAHLPTPIMNPAHDHALLLTWTSPDVAENMADDTPQRRIAFS